MLVDSFLEVLEALTGANNIARKTAENEYTTLRTNASTQLYFLLVEVLSIDVGQTRISFASKLLACVLLVPSYVIIMVTKMIMSSIEAPNR